MQSSYYSILQFVSFFVVVFLLFAIIWFVENILKFDSVTFRVLLIISYFIIGYFTYNVEKKELEHVVVMNGIPIQQNQGHVLLMMV